LIKKIDALIERKGYTICSESIRELIRERFVDQEREADTRKLMMTMGKNWYNKNLRNSDRQERPNNSSRREYGKSI